MKAGICCCSRLSLFPTFRNGNTMRDREYCEIDFCCSGILDTRQHRRDDLAGGTTVRPANAIFGGVSTGWKKARGKLPEITRVIPAYTCCISTGVGFRCSCLSGRWSLCGHVADLCGVEVLHCAYSNGCGLPPIAFFQAAARGQLDMVQWVL